MEHLTPDELKRLLQEVKKPRQRLMLKVAYHHGLRVSELLSLEKSNIRDGCLTIQRLKGSLPTVQGFRKVSDPWLQYASELDELSRTIKPGEKVFPMTRDGVLKLIKRAGRRAGIPEGMRYHTKLKTHALKHTIAMHTIGSGIENVRQWLGHRNIASTGAYLKKVSDEAAGIAIDRAREAAFNAPPRK